MASQCRITILDDDEVSQLKQGGLVWTLTFGFFFSKLKMLNSSVDWIMHSYEVG
jgi:hypothetical protein